MESTQILETSPAQAALSALEESARNGQKVTVSQLVEARAAADLEGFAAQAAERAEAARKADELSQLIAGLGLEVQALKDDESPVIARQKLESALEEYGAVCGDYKERRRDLLARIERLEAVGRINQIKGNEAFDALKASVKGNSIKEARIKHHLFVIAREKLKHYSPRENFELKEHAD